MTGDGVMNRRRFLQSMAAVGVVVACGPTATASPSPSATASGSPAPKAVSIEWWRRNYATGTQSAETITSDAAVKAYKDRAANVTIAIQGGPFGGEEADLQARRRQADLRFRARERRVRVHAHRRWPAVRQFHQDLDLQQCRRGEWPREVGRARSAEGHAARLPHAEPQRLAGALHRR